MSSLLFDENDPDGFFVFVDRMREILPSLSVEIDFTNAPTNPSRVWTNVNADLRALDYILGGRNHELQRTEAGTLTAVLDNRHGDYDPGNPASPYYPGVKRMRWIRVRARWESTIHLRWQGLIETWTQDWPGLGRDATVNITAADTFKILSLFDLEGLSFGAQRTDERVAAVCAAAGVSSSVQTGKSSVVASGVFGEGSSALSHLLAVEETENGLVYASGDEVIFEDRHYRALTSDVADAKIGDTGTNIRYRSGTLDLDDADIWNVVSVTPDGGTPEIATDTTSTDNHYERRLNRTILSSSQAEAADAARYLVRRYADPSPRIPQVTVLGAVAPGRWPTILALKNSDRVIWYRNTTVREITVHAYVERVADTIRPDGGTWDVTFQLSPAGGETGWLLGHATRSLVGVSTFPVY